MLNMASLVAQRAKNLPVMQKTWVQSLGQDDPLEKGMIEYSSILAWKIPLTEELAAMVHRVAKSWTRLSYQHFHLMLSSRNIQESRK